MLDKIFNRKYVRALALMENEIEWHETMVKMLQHLIDNIEEDNMYRGHIEADLEYYQHKKEALEALRLDFRALISL